MRSAYWTRWLTLQKTWVLADDVSVVIIIIILISVYGYRVANWYKHPVEVQFEIDHYQWATWIPLIFKEIFSVIKET